MNTTIKNAMAASEAFEPEFVSVPTTVKANELVKGDRIEGGIEVESKRMGNSKVIVKLAGLKTEKRYSFEDTFEVVREVQTEESKALGEAVRKEARAAATLQGWLNAPEAARAKLDERLASDNPTWNITDLAADYRLAAVRAAWAEMVLRMVEREDAEYGSLVEAMTAFVESLKEQLIEGHDDPTYSGGFSYGNADRQAMVELRRKTVRDARWGWY